MPSKKKLKKKIRELEKRQLQDIPKKKRKIGFIGIVGVFISLLTLGLLYQQNKIIQKQHDLDEKQTSLQEKELIHKLFDIDVDDKQSVDKFLEYVDLLDDDIANKYLLKASKMDASYLSFNALTKLYQRKHLFQNGGLRPEELAGYVLLIDEKIKRSADKGGINPSGLDYKQVKIIADVKNNFSYEDYRCYLLQLSERIPYFLNLTLFNGYLPALYYENNRTIYKYDVNYPRHLFPAENIYAMPDHLLKPFNEYRLGITEPIELLLESTEMKELPESIGVNEEVFVSNVNFWEILPKNWGIEIPFNYAEDRVAYMYLSFWDMRYGHTPEQLKGQFYFSEMPYDEFEIFKDLLSRYMNDVVYKSETEEVFFKNLKGLGAILEENAFCRYDGYRVPYYEL